MPENTPFILDNLIGYLHLGDILIKALSWFCLERDRGRPSTRVTEIREWSNTASIRKTEIIFKVSAGQIFEIPEVLICLACQVFSSWPCHGWDLEFWLPAADQFFRLCALSLRTTFPLFPAETPGGKATVFWFFPISQNNASCWRTFTPFLSYYLVQKTELFQYLST